MIDKKQKQVDGLIQVIEEYGGAHMLEHWYVLCNEKLSPMFKIKNIRCFSMLVRKIRVLGYSIVYEPKYFKTKEGKKKVVFCRFIKKVVDI